MISHENEGSACKNVAVRKNSA